ncbi:uncharacterized protein LOC127785849 [Oryza glaberrima]|uniref:uncharacterized protein LOC127785849 n=1 Tax=Oryza glaberrima TaxID=4538 RepID=UPI00224C0E4B|nr:uncharacterized protein LOC127785849 [Oryza glaberrima]
MSSSTNPSVAPLAKYAKKKKTVVKKKSAATIDKSAPSQLSSDQTPSAAGSHHIEEEEQPTAPAIPVLADLFSFDIRDYLDKAEEDTSSKALAPLSDDEYALMKSNPPTAQRRSPRRPQGQATGDPKIQPGAQRSSRKPGSRKRKIIFYDDDDDDDDSNKEASGKQPKKASPPKKKTTRHPISKIRKSSRKPSDIDPTSKDSDPADNSETTGEKTCSATAAGSEPSKEVHPTGSQSATGEAEAGNEPPTGNQSATAETSMNQEPPTGNQPGDNTENLEQPEKIIPEIEGQASSPALNDTDAGPESNTFDKVEGPARPPPKIITALEKLVPHLGTLEETRAKLHETKEEARKMEHALRDRVAELLDANFELSGSSKVQAAKIAELERQVKALKDDKNAISKERDLAVKEFEDHKGKTKAQIDFLVNKTERSEEHALDLINDGQKTADKIAADVLERFQDTSLSPAASDDEKTESE